MSQNSSPIRNPAPHRGFNPKAREVLLDSTKEFTGMRRSDSDEEFLRRVGLIRFRRAGSEESESGGSTPKRLTNNATKGENFDGLDELPKMRSTNRKSLKSGHLLLGDIGKAHSVGDLSKRISRASLKSFQQPNNLKIQSYLPETIDTLEEEIGMPSTEDVGRSPPPPDNANKKVQYKAQ